MSNAINARTDSHCLTEQFMETKLSSSIGGTASSFTGVKKRREETELDREALMGKDIHSIYPVVLGLFQAPAV